MSANGRALLKWSRDHWPKQRNFVASLSIFYSTYLQNYNFWTEFKAEIWGQELWDKSQARY